MIDKTLVRTSEILETMKSTSQVTDEQIQQFNKFKINELKKISKNMKIRKSISL